VRSTPDVKAEITPGMVEAGLEKLFDYPETADAEETVIGVFTAMSEAQRVGRVPFWRAR
jgi:hypothetical protein